MNELFAARQRYKACKDKLRQHLYKIAARPLLTTVKALIAKLKLEESVSTATTLVTNQVITCEGDEVVGNQMADVQRLLNELERL